MTTLPGFTAGETLIVVAAYYHSRSGELDLPNLQKHISSASVVSVKVRLNAVRRKVVDLDTLPEVKDVKAPAGGVSKTSRNKVHGKVTMRAGAGKSEGKGKRKGKGEKSRNVFEGEMSEEAVESKSVDEAGTGQIEQGDRQLDETTSGESHGVNEEIDEDEGLLSS